MLVKLGNHTGRNSWFQINLYMMQLLDYHFRAILKTSLLLEVPAQQ